MMDGRYKILVDEFGLSYLKRIELRNKFTPVLIDNLNPDESYQGATIALGKFYNHYNWLINNPQDINLIQLVVSGYDHLDLKKLNKDGVKVYNSGGANSQSVAEHTIMLMLCVYRQTIFHHFSVVNGSFFSKKNSNLELSGKSICVVGFGKIGQVVSNLAKSFGMKVFVYDPFYVKNIEKLGFSKISNLYTSRSKFDFISLHCPLTKRTRGMIDYEFLKGMKKTGVLINCARGKIQKDQDLLRALKNREISAVALDVFENENSSCIFSITKENESYLDRSIFSPHAGPSFETREKCLDFINSNIKKFLIGEELSSPCVSYDDE